MRQLEARACGPSPAATTRGWAPTTPSSASARARIWSSSPPTLISRLRPGRARSASTRSTIRAWWGGRSALTTSTAASPTPAPRATTPGTRSSSSGLPPRARRRGGASPPRHSPAARSRSSSTGATPSIHPSTSAPTGLTLVSFHLEHPQPEVLTRVLDALSVQAAVVRGPTPALVARSTALVVRRTCGNRFLVLGDQVRSGTASSPSADQSSWGMVKLTIRGVSTRCGGIKGHRIDDPIVSPVGKDGIPAASWTRPPRSPTTASREPRCRCRPTTSGTPDISEVA